MSKQESEAWGMEVAVLSDIHGNYVALETCVNYALERGVENFIFLGDYLGELAYPQKTMRFLYALKEKYRCWFIKGNKETYWLKYNKAWKFCTLLQNRLGKASCYLLIMMLIK